MMPTGCARTRSASSSMPSTGRRSSADALSKLSSHADRRNRACRLRHLQAPADQLRRSAASTRCAGGGAAEACPDRRDSQAAAPSRTTQAAAWPTFGARSTRPAAARGPGECGRARAADTPRLSERGAGLSIRRRRQPSLRRARTSNGYRTAGRRTAVGSGPVAAGDTVRWIIGDTESGTAAAKKVHILVKPTRPELITNLVINTDRRTYHLELRSTEKTYMASVSWIYPQDELIALRQRNALAAAAAPVETALDINSLSFRYAIEGDNPPWRPLRAFDDGRKVYIEFPRGIGQGEMPPLFIVGPEGKTSELVNYRVRGSHMIVDRLFAAAELRLGDGGSERRVRIVRTDGRLFW